MNKSTRAIPLVAVVALATVMLGGCSESGCPFCSPAAQTGPPAAVGEAAEGGGAALCGMCGQIKESELCCTEGAERCEKCGLVAGSPGCCKIEKGADVKLCAGCGQIKDSEACCAEGAEKCEKCGLAKGSPGCCKIGV